MESVVRINGVEIKADATTLPVKMEAENVYSQEVMVFVCNGVQYKLFISKQGKLVVNK